MALAINGTTGISGVDGSASAPAIVGSDSNTGFSFGTDTISLNTGGSTRATVDSSGNFGVGTTSPVSNSGYGGFSLNGSSGSIASLMFNGTEKLRLFGHTNPSIQYAGDLTFFNGVSGGTERMRIRSNGLVTIATTSALINESGLSVRSGGNTCVLKAENAAGHNPLICWNTNEQGTRQQIQFGDGASFGSRGSITTNGGNVSYGGTSDYRRKQDDVLITDGIEKIKLLKPKRFKWKEVPDLGICDGFFAHEVQEVVPTSQAVTGTKDEVDSEGNPVYQQIDQSKLIPLLVAALKEAVGKIETLETKVAALEAA